MTTTRIEAESWTLVSGFTIEASGSASGGNRIRTTASGVAQHTHALGDGVYDIVIGHWDESDGQSTASLLVNGQQIDAWTWNVDADQTSTNATTASFVARRVAGITLRNGDLIEYRATGSSAEPARTDYFEFTYTGGLGAIITGAAAAVAASVASAAAVAIRITSAAAASLSAVSAAGSVERAPITGAASSSGASSSSAAAVLIRGATALAAARATLGAVVAGAIRAVEAATKARSSSAAAGVRTTSGAAEILGRSTARAAAGGVVRGSASITARATMRAQGRLAWDAPSVPAPGWSEQEASQGAWAPASAPGAWGI